MSEAGRLVIKVSLGDDIRCIPIHNEDITYDELVLMMQRVFRGKVNTGDDVLIKYKDEDGDLVTIFDSSDLTYAINCSKTLKLTLFVNQQPRQLSSEESRYLRHQLQDVRDRVNHLLDKLDNHGLPSVTDSGADSVTNGSRPASAAGGASGQVAATTASSSAAAGSFDPLTRQKYAPTRDGTTTGSADTGAQSSLSVNSQQDMAQQQQQRQQQPQQLPPGYHPSMPPQQSPYMNQPAVQSPYSHEVPQDTQASQQVPVGYGGPPPVRHPYGPAAGAPQHQQTAGIPQATSSPSHSGQQMPVPPAHRPMYVSTVPSAMPPGQPAAVSYSQPAGYAASQQHYVPAAQPPQQVTSAPQAHNVPLPTSNQPPNPYSRSGPVYGQYPQPHGHYPPAQ